MLSPEPAIGNIDTAACTNTIGSKSAVAPPVVNASVTVVRNCSANDMLDLTFSLRGQS